MVRIYILWVMIGVLSSYFVYSDPQPEPDSVGCPPGFEKKSLILDGGKPVSSCDPACTLKVTVCCRYNSADSYLSFAEHIALNKVRFRVWWSQVLLPENFKFQIIDLLGRPIDTGNLIEFKQTNNYSGEILINAETLPSDIYLFTIFTGTRRIGKAFVVL